MTTAKTTPTEEYQEAGRDQAQGQAKMDTAKGTVESGDAQAVEGAIQKAEGVAAAQKAPNIDYNDVKNTSH